MRCEGLSPLTLIRISGAYGNMVRVFRKYFINQLTWVVPVGAAPPPRLTRDSSPAFMSWSNGSPDGYDGSPDGFPNGYDGSPDG